MPVKEPVITVRGGFYDSGLEETLNEFSTNFEKMLLEEGNGYKLFNPSREPYFMVVTESPDKEGGFASNPVGVAVVSHSETRNREVLEEFQEKIGIILEEGEEWEEALYETGLDKNIIHDFNLYMER